MSRYKVILIFGLMLICLSTANGQSKMLPYRLNCDYGKQHSQSERVQGFTIQVNPEQQRCRAVVSNDDGRIVFDRTATGIQVSPAINLGGHGPYVLIQATVESPATLSVVSLGDHPGLVTTIENKYGFWLQKGCADGHWHIWTADGGFQGDPELTGIYHYDLIVPEVVLDLHGQKLVDVTPRCKEHFDKRVAATKAHLSARQLQRFKNHGISDEFEAGRVKGDVLEIAFSYLYTKRDTAAKRVLHQMWPTDEVNEIWEWMTKKRSEGFLKGISGNTEPN